MVFATSPTLVTPALGTPASGTLTNCTFPTLNQNTSGTAAGLSATLAVSSGGTGATTAAGAVASLGAAPEPVVLTGSLNLVEGTTYIANGGSTPTLTLPDPSAANKVIIIHGWQPYTLNNGNSGTSAISANTLAICISASGTLGDWTVKTPTITYGANISF